MTPTIISFPTLTATPSRSTWTLKRMDGRFTSPLSGTFQDIQRPGAQWVCEMSWQVLSYADSQALAAWADQMSQAGTRTYLPNFAYSAQGGVYVGAVNGSGQTGSTLILNGLAASTTITQAGDFITVTDGTKHQLLRIVSNGVSDSSGNLTISFTPALRLSPTNGAGIVFGIPSVTNPPIYKSDWQGNQLQYSTPRTNVLEHSETPLLWSESAGVSATAKTSIVPGAGGTASLYATGASPASNAQCYPPNWTATFNGVATFSLMVEYSSSAQVFFEFYDITSSAPLGGAYFNFGTQIITPQFSGEVVSATPMGTGPNGGALYKLTAQTFNPIVLGHSIEFAVLPAGNPAVANVATIIHAAQVEQGSTATSIIATTTAPVTVTDYSISGSTIVFSAVPANGAGLTLQAGGVPYQFGTGNGTQTVFSTGLPVAAFAFAKPESSMSYTAPRIAAFSMSLEEDITI